MFKYYLQIPLIIHKISKKLNNYHIILLSINYYLDLKVNIV